MNDETKPDLSNEPAPDTGRQPAPRKSKKSKHNMNKEAEANAPKKLKSKKYLKELRKLQAELCHLQEWVKYKGLRVIIVFEGRDAAGKGGTIKAITERVSAICSTFPPRGRS